MTRLTFPSATRKFWSTLIFSSFAIAAALLSANALAQVEAPPPVLAARNWLLIDVTSGQTLTGQDANARVDPASLTKLMTEYLVLQALRDKKLTLEQQVNVPVDLYKRVNRKEESVMFIPPGQTASVDDLLHGLIIQSGNDAALVLAEAVAGNETTFVDMMNREAKRIGMNATNYRNAAGLTDPQHYTTPSDLAILVSHLITEFPEYYKLYSQKEFTYDNIKQQNRNRLLWIDPSVDGVKTGHTDAAGYCLISSAHRPMITGGERRLLAVVLGANSSEARAQESLKLLNWGYQNFDDVKVYDANQVIATPEIWKGKTNTVRLGFTHAIYLTVPKGQGGNVKSILDYKKPLIAPINSGDKVGSVKLTLDQKPIGDFPVVAMDSVAQAGVFGRAWDSIRLMFNHQQQ
jgi:D-alanyl-D-alanine carboxypeptidase (penicillin-binding protein 5/6)